MIVHVIKRELLSGVYFKFQFECLTFFSIITMVKTSNIFRLILLTLIVHCAAGISDCKLKYDVEIHESVKT